MRVDGILDPSGPGQVADLARAAERAGFDRVRIPETRHDPFVLSALALAATGTLEVGTEVAIAFARSPTVVAHSAWDLAALSGGRFHLGLGSQVRAHVERRYGMPWDRPVRRMREYLQCLQALWECWQRGTPLRVQGEFYRLTLMTPFFSPGPIANPSIPVGLGGVSPTWARLAGEMTRAFHVHPLHTPSYLRGVIVPAIEAGLARSGRSRESFEVVGSVFVVSGDDHEALARSREDVRRHVGFYASTPSYRRLLAHHGWEDAGERLSQLARERRWKELAGAVPDGLLREATVEGGPEEVAAQIRERYSGLFNRVALYLPYRPGERDEWWQRWVRALREASP